MADLSRCSSTLARALSSASSVEAFSSPHYHPMSQGIALEGMKLVIENLPRAYDDGGDIEARAHMMSAAARLSIRT